MKTTTNPAARTCPFVGPRPFQRGEPLFGRDREIPKLLDLIIAERIVMLFSPSGAGKTSLIQAGLIPALREEGFHDLPVIRVGLPPSEAAGPAGVPTLNRYIQAVLASMTVEPPEGAVEPSAALAEFDHSLSAAFGRRLAAVSSPSDGRKPRLVLIFDQFEEILTTDPTDRAAKEALFDQLGAALKDPSLWALFALREEYVAALEPYLNRIPRRLASRFRLDLLDASSAREAFEKLFASREVSVAPEAAVRLIDDLRRVLVQRPDGSSQEVLGPSVEPVHLQIVGLRLWNRHATDPRFHRLDETHLSGTEGGVDAALTGYYADKVREIGQATGIGERRIREWCEHQLLTDQGLRGQVLREPGQTRGLAEPVIQKLIDAFLVRAEDRRGSTWYELAHDRLIEPIRLGNESWRQEALKPWQRSAILWQQTDQSEGLLLRGWAYFRAMRQSRRPFSEPPTEVEKRYLAASRRALRRRLLQRLVGFVFVLAVTGLGIVAALEWWRAVQLLADSRHKSAEILLEQALDHCRRGEVDRGMLLLTRSLAAAPEDAELQRSIRTQLSAWLPSLNRLRDIREDKARRKVLSDEGIGPELLATDSTLGARIRAALPGGDVRHLFEQMGPIYAAALGADGHTLFVSRQSSLATLRDITTGRPTGKPFPREILESKAFLLGPDSRILVAIPGAATRDRNDNVATARLWDVAERKPIGDLLEHASTINSVHFRPDGQVVLTICEDGTACLWDAAKGLKIKPLIDKPQGAIQNAVFSPDGRTILTAGPDDTARLWDACTGDPIGARPIEHHGDTAKATFNRTSDYILTRSTADGSIITNARTGEPIGRKFGREEAVAFGPDGASFIVGGAAGVATIHDIATQQAKGPPFVHGAPVTIVRFRDDGRKLVTGSGEVTRLWDLATRKVIPLGEAHDAIFSPDGRLLLLIVPTGGEPGDWQYTATIRDVENGVQVGRPMKLAHRVRGLWNPDSKSFLAYGVYGAELWDIASGESRRVSPYAMASQWDITYFFHGNAQGGKSIFHDRLRDPLQSYAFSKDGRLLLAPEGELGLNSWACDSRSDRDISLGPLEERLTAAAFGPDGKTVFTRSFTEVVESWDLRLGQPVGEPLRHPYRVWSIAPSHDPSLSTVLTGAADKIVRLWERATAKVRSEPARHFEAVLSVAFSPDDTLILSGGADGTARLTDVKTGGAVGSPYNLRRPVIDVGFENEKTLKTWTDDGSVWIWDLASKSPGKETGTAPLFSTPPRGGGKRLIENKGSSSNGPEYWLDDEKGNRIAGPFGHGSLREVGLGAELSDDGKTVLTFDESGMMKVWDVDDQDKSRTMKPRPIQAAAPLRWAAIGPNGKIGASVHEDSVQLWDLASGTRLGGPLRHDAPIETLAFSPDGRLLMTSCADRMQRFWFWDINTYRMVGPALKDPVRFPEPMEGELERISTWLSTVTGQRIDETAGISALDVSDWLKLRRRLDELGGPPIHTIQ
jgi:WD40 repeat protein